MRISETSNSKEENKELDFLIKYVIEDPKFVKKNKKNKFFDKKIEILTRELTWLFHIYNHILYFLDTDKNMTKKNVESIFKPYEKIKENLIKELWEENIPKRFKEVYNDSRKYLYKQMKKKDIKVSILYRVKDILNIKK